MIIRILLLREYLNKWRNKIKEIKDKENKSIVIIQKVIRGRKVKNDFIILLFNNMMSIS